MSTSEADRPTDDRPTWATMDREARRAACLAGRKAGKSASQIAKELVTTRNSVIGILKRLADSGVRVPASPHGHGPKKVAAAKLPTNSQAKRPASSMPRVQVNAGGVLSEIKSRIAAASENYAVIAREHAFDPIPGTTPITLMECGPRNCRWAVDGLYGPSRLFCGEPKEPEEGFCKSHQQLAYQPLHARERATGIATATMKKAA